MDRYSHQIEDDGSLTVRYGFTVRFDRETDGRWIAYVAQLPGVQVYGMDKVTAWRAALVLALRVTADQIAHGEEKEPNREEDATDSKEEDSP